MQELPTMPVTIREGARVQDVRQRLKETRDRLARTPELDYVAHYRNKVFDFSADRFPGAPEPGGESARGTCELAGGQFTYTMVRLGERLSDLQSGALIRMLVQGAEATMAGYAIVPREHLVAVSRRPVRPGRLLTEQEPARADRAMSELVTGLRLRLQLGDQNPGGHPTPVRDQLDLAAVDGPGTRRVEDLCAAAVQRGNLHYVAFHRDGEPVVSADRLESPDLEVFLPQMSVQGRRNRYVELSYQAPGWIRELTRATRPVLGGGIRRVVLDVEQGAVYFYRVSLTEFFVGVTLTQNSVAEADARMAALVAHYGRPPASSGH